jgi:glutaminase
VTAPALPTPLGDLLERSAADVAAAADAAGDGFGMAVATLDGDVHGVGEWERAFPIQSISKVFGLALAVAHDGPALWRRVGREPSGDPFNSLMQLERDAGVPRNPFVNAGAIVVTDVLLAATGDAAGAIRDLVREQSGNPGIDVDAAVVAAEAARGDRNAAIAHLISGYGNLTASVGVVLDHYDRACALRMSCRDLAVAATFLARHGVGRRGVRLLSRSDAKRVNAVMLTCGTYDAAGEFAYRVGLPGKSGVSGGLLAIVPGRCALCAWSPRLDAAGNSVAAVAALDAFTTLSGWSVF